MPFISDFWDIVMACEVLEHLKIPEAGVRELHRVTKKYALITVPLEPWWRIANVMRLRYVKSGGNTPGHVQHFTKRKFYDLMSTYFNIITYRRIFLWQCMLVEKK